MAKKIVMTYEGMKKLQDELQSLKVDRRKDVAKKLQEAREQETYQRTQSTMQLRMSSVT